MAKKKGRRIYLGTTRRQENTRRMTLWVTLGLIFIIVIASAAFFSWMLADPPADNPAGEDTQTEDTSPEGKDPDKAETVTVTGEPYKPNGKRREWIVMLDAGHGFDDIGTTSPLLGETNEATVNLDIVLSVAEILKASGVSVRLTHDTNAVNGRPSAAEGGEGPSKGATLLSATDRIALTEAAEADLFVSVHCDSIPDSPDVSGMRMYYCNSENDILTKRRNSGAEALSCHIADGFWREMGEGTVLPRIRALREDDAFYVIRALNIPSVLCEVGFVTNKTDAENMLSEKWRQSAAQGIADGIIAYITKAE